MFNRMAIFTDRARYLCVDLVQPIGICRASSARAGNKRPSCLERYLVLSIVPTASYNRQTCIYMNSRKYYLDNAWLNPRANLTRNLQLKLAVNRSFWHVWLHNNYSALSINYSVLLISSSTNRHHKAVNKLVSAATILLSVSH